MTSETTYWLTLAHLPKWGNEKKNRLIVNFYHDEKITIEDFFNLPETVWRSKYDLDESSVNDLKQAKSEFPSNAFLAESLLNQGYELIPITSADYSKTLKQNLKASHAPTLLYIKGNKQILQEKSIAIVGSRSADSKSLEFTDNVAKIASKNFKVVVSGFAKGVDKQALDSAIKYKGQSIIVLPQGITTFGSGYKTYYKQIVNGDVLVLSIFPPKAGWSTGLAMARNPIIYGLASDIFVAESSDSGGTWSGVIDGLKRGRKIFVRQPENNEKNANLLLIKKGAIAVDFYGNEILEQKEYDTTQPQAITLNEPSISDTRDIVIALLKEKALTVKEILEKTKLDWSPNKLTTYLKGIDEVEVNKARGVNLFGLKRTQPEQKSIF